MCRVLIVPGSSRKALAIVSSIRKYKICEPYVLFYSNHPHLYSRYLKDKVLLNMNKAYVSEREYVKNILLISLTYDIDYVLPIDWQETVLLSKYKSLFKKYGINVIAPQYEKIVQASDKTSLPELVKGIVQCPPQETIRSKLELSKVTRISPPLVVKGIRMIQSLNTF